MNQLIISPWDWLEVQLRLRSLELKSEWYSVHYELDLEGNQKVQCNIFCQQTLQMRSDGDSLDAQKEYYSGWLSSERDAVEEIFERWPAVRSSVKVDEELLYQVVDEEGVPVIMMSHQGKLTWWKSQGEPGR